MTSHRRMGFEVGSRVRGHAGAVLVEFALSLPILLLILVGIFDFGFLFQKQQVVTNAAREGARMAVLTGYSVADVQARVAAYLTAGGVTETPDTDVDPPVTITPAGGNPFTVVKVTVTVTYTFAYLGPIAALTGGNFGTTDLQGVAVMRTEVAAGT